jgi:prevent-host-death family protein
MASATTETIAISVFKATCLAVLERVRRTGASVLVTKRGEPIAEINPPARGTKGEEWLGAMRGTATMTDDLVNPANAQSDWEAFDA